MSNNAWLHHFIAGEIKMIKTLNVTVFFIDFIFRQLTTLQGKTAEYVKI